LARVATAATLGGMTGRRYVACLPLLLVAACSAQVHVTRSRPSPTPSSPSPTPSRTPRPPATSPAPTAIDFLASTHDGQPGWGTGYTGCGDATALPARGVPPFPDVTLTLVLPARPLRAGREYTADVVLRNTGTRTRSFTVDGLDADDATTLLDGARHGSARTWSDALSSQAVDLRPGATLRYRVLVVTSGCADGPEDPPPPLPAGTYRLGFGVAWFAGTRNELWSVPPVTVTLT
jgi:hypothetical protein